MMYKMCPLLFWAGRAIVEGEGGGIMD